MRSDSLITRGRNVIALKYLSDGPSLTFLDRFGHRLPDGIVLLPAQVRPQRRWRRLSDKAVQLASAGTARGRMTQQQSRIATPTIRSGLVATDRHRDDDHG